MTSAPDTPGTGDHASGLRSRPGWVLGTVRALWVLATAAVVWGSLTPVPLDLLPVPEGDKIVHFGAYALLSGLGAWSLPGSRGRGLSAASMAALGSLIEVLQYWVPGRSSSWADAACNVAGAGLGYWLAGRWALDGAWTGLTAFWARPKPWAGG